MSDARNQIAQLLPQVPDGEMAGLANLIQVDIERRLQAAPAGHEFDPLPGDDVCAECGRFEGAHT